MDLCDGGELVFRPDPGFEPGPVCTSPRIGVDYAGPWAHALLRFYLPGSPGVSGPAKRQT
jgi:3-methyladenine DNA glycosylase Mpg